MDFDPDEAGAFRSISIQPFGGIQSLREQQRHGAPTNGSSRVASSFVDPINHHLLMERVRARVGNLKVTRLVSQFLKASYWGEAFVPTSKGTPKAE